MSGQPGGFTDDFCGIRLTVGGSPQRAYRLRSAIRQLKAEDTRSSGMCWARGSSQAGEFRAASIASCGLKEDFPLWAAVTNPYPYYRQTDIYVHATGYRGKAFAIQEAQTLGCAIVTFECNREQITI